MTTYVVAVTDPSRPIAGSSAEMQIDEYLRDRLMPLEGAIPHLPGTEMYGDSIPAATAGGDLFECINFQQRYDIDARIRRALESSSALLKSTPQTSPVCSSSHDYLESLRSRPEYRTEIKAVYREARSLEQVQVSENLAALKTTAGVLLVDAQGHGVISAKILDCPRDVPRLDAV